MAQTYYEVLILALALFSAYLLTIVRRHKHKWNEAAMKRGRAKKRLRQIWLEEHPGCLSIEDAFRTPDPWKWFNIYANLQNRDETVETGNVSV
jgi:hypothetical protein